MHIKILLLIFVLSLSLYKIKEGYTGFEYLMDEFRSIFSNGNRNAGGPQFYNHIYEIKNNLMVEDYIEHNTHFCGVSGSPISPYRGKRFDYVKVKHVNGKEYVGKYYRCCWPCLCDVMKYTLADDFTIELKDGPYDHLVLTIGDPCINESQIPEQVSSYRCVNGLTQNGIRTESGRLIYAILHDYEEYDSGKHDSLINPILEQCEERMNTEPDNLRGGMGDIFVKLAIIND